MIRILQLKHARLGRRVALVSGDELSLLKNCDSLYRLLETAFARGQSLVQAVADAAVQEKTDYNAIHRGASDWHLLPPFDHPDEPSRCLVTGTGLTHKKSADNRQAMHVNTTAPVTDSRRMYEWGVAGGRPTPGQIGVQPEWFYKGCGGCLRAHREPLEVPAFGLDGGEEAEVAGVYWIDPNGVPRRVGLALANEFSDHKLEAKNYLYLAHSKLRTCAFGPELIVDPEFNDARGTVRLWRGKEKIWERAFATGEANMSHTLANLEHHHFKYAAHRRPGDVHIHFLGADAFSFGEGIQLKDGDEMELELAGFGRPLRNPLRVVSGPEQIVAVKPA